MPQIAQKTLMIRDPEDGNMEIFEAGDELPEWAAKHLAEKGPKANRPKTDPMAKLEADRARVAAQAEAAAAAAAAGEPGADDEADDSTDPDLDAMDDEALIAYAAEGEAEAVAVLDHELAKDEPSDDVVAAAEAALS